MKILFLSMLFLFNIIVISVAQNDQTNDLKFKQLPNGGANHSKVINLLNKNLYPEYKLLENKDIDFYNLLTAAFSEYKHENFDSLNLLLFEAGIISNEELEKFNYFYKKSLNSKLDYKEIIKIYAIKKLLSEESSKKLLVSGLRRSKISLKNNYIEAYDEYIKSKININQLFFSHNEIFEILESKVKTKDELRKAVMVFLNQFLFDVNLDSKTTDLGFDIISNQETYSFKLDDFRQKDYNNPIIDKNGEESYLFMDSINLDLDFYNSILERVKQITADNNINDNFTIKYLSDLFEIKKHDYQSIIGDLEELKFMENSMYIVRLYNIASFVDRIPLSFTVLNDRSYDQFRLNLIGEVDEYKAYVKSSYKRKFLDIVRKYKKELGVNNAKMEQIEQITYEGLFREPSNLISILPTEKLFLDKYNQEQFPEIKKETSLQKIFPSLAQFLKNDFSIKNLITPNKGKYFLTFGYKGKKVGVVEQDGYKYMSLIKVIDIILLKDYNKGIFELMDRLERRRTMIILNYDLKEELENLFGQKYFTDI